MIKQYIHKNLKWIDLDNPTKEDIIKVMDQYTIHPLVAEELLNSTIRPKVDVYKDNIYLILHFPNNTGSGDTSETEIDFVIGKDFIITAHYETSLALHEFSKAFETNALLDKTEIGDHAGYLFFYMLRLLYKELNDNLDQIGLEIKESEKNIYSGKESAMVRVLSETHRKLLDFKQAIRFHGEILRSFSEVGKDFFGVDFSHYLISINSEFWKVSNALESHKEILEELRETNMSLLTTKSNKIMKTISILAFVFLPMTVLAPIIASNILGEFITESNDFTFFIASSLILSGGLFTWFKSKKWI